MFCLWTLSFGTQVSGFGQFCTNFFLRIILQTGGQQAWHATRLISKTGMVLNRLLGASAYGKKKVLQREFGSW